MTKDELETLVRQGATLPDIGRTLNTDWAAAQRELRSQNVDPPSAARPTAQDLVIQRFLGNIPEGRPASVEELLAQLDYPKLSHQIDPFVIYEKFHGGYVDPYSGAATDRSKLRFLNVVGGRPRTFLVSNMEALSDETRAARFSETMPPVAETFRFRFGVEPNLVSFSLTISRPYDRLVGGTYSAEYMRQLFDRWVGLPWRTLGRDEPDMESALPRRPFELAWWVFLTMSHYALLKGLVEVRVRDDHYGSEAVLSDDIVQMALMGSIAREGSPLIATPPPRSPKFDPSILLR